MPIYEFQCNECKQIDELMCGISESESIVIPCEVCKESGKEAYFKKIISATRGLVRDGASPRVLRRPK